MAKLSARGAHKVEGFRVTISDNLGSDPERETWYYKYALRSDGKVLRAVAHRSHGKYGYTDGGTYKIIGTLKEGVSLQSYLERKFGVENVTKSNR